METTAQKSKRSPKRLSVDSLKKRVEERMLNAGYKGVDVFNVQWDTLEYDQNLKRQTVVINTVDQDGKLDGNIRTVATSDLQHVRHTKEVSDIVKRNSKRKSKKK